jgi:hypothetical protein
MRGMLPAAALGAAVMYWMDPDRGKLRRAQLRDRTVHLARSGGRRAQHSAVDLANHAGGLVAELRASVRSERPSDDVLVQHVRSTMGHVVRHPHRLMVSAERGCIQLRGDVLSDEKDALIRAIEHIPGVCGVEAQLNEHGWIGGQPVATDAQATVFRERLSPCSADAQVWQSAIRQRVPA